MRLLLILLVTLTVNACAERTVADPPPARSNTWSEFCATVDCSQYPLGRFTVELDAERYYLPLAKDLGFVVDPRSARVYRERNSQGEIIRAVRTTSRKRMIEFARCCERLSEAVGLPLPQGSGFSNAYAIEFFLTRNLEYRLPLPATNKRFFASAEDLISRRLASFNADFWLIETHGSPTSFNTSGVLQELLLVSKRPMMFGRHVLLECGSLCIAETLYFPDEPQRGQPSARVRLRRAEGSWPTCPTPNSDKLCELRQQFTSTPDTLHWVEQLFEELKTKPQI